MSDLQITGMQFHVILTPSEFSLVTKGLLGTISDEPERRVTPDSPRGDGRTSRDARKVEVNDKEDARDLGIRLMERRKHCMEKQVQKAEVHIEHALEAMKRGVGE